MKCDLCDNEATTHLTQVVEGQVEKVHFCEECATAQGLSVDNPSSVTDVLMGLGKESHKPKSASILKCPECGLSRSDFKKGGRLGCPSCYTTFHVELESLVKAMHHSLQHTGKVPQRQYHGLFLEREVERIERDILVAVDEEAFEDAADLKNRLEEFKNELEDSEQ